MTAIGPWLISNTLGKLVLPEHRWEVVRVVSPDQTVDAVMVGSGCGALCSDTYLVTVVPRGGKVPTNIERFAFSADDMADPQLHWQQPHLLEIRYSRALINDFRNIVYPFAKFGDRASWDYEVELRLVPSSLGFSYLKTAAN